MGQHCFGSDLEVLLFRIQYIDQKTSYRDQAIKVTIVERIQCTNV